MGDQLLQIKLTSLGAFDEAEPAWAVEEQGRTPGVLAVSDGNF